MKQDMFSRFYEWWSEQSPWLRYGVAVICLLPYAAVPWPWGEVLLVIGGLSAVAGIWH